MLHVALMRFLSERLMKICKPPPSPPPPPPPKKRKSWSHAEHHIDIDLLIHLQKKLFITQGQGGEGGYSIYYSEKLSNAHLLKTSCFLLAVETQVSYIGYS